MKHTDRPISYTSIYERSSRMETMGSVNSTPTEPGPIDVKWPSTRLGLRKPDSPDPRPSAQPLAWSLHCHSGMITVPTNRGG